MSSDPHEKRIIARSWKRCQAFQVPIGREYAPSAANIDELLQEKNRRELYQQALPNLQKVSHHLENTDYSLIMTDQEGIVLYNDGDPPIKNELERLNLWPGGIWSEAEAGTNAMGTTLLEKRPTLILGDEHYCIGWKRFSCAGYPVFSGSGKIRAVIDVTGFAEHFSPGTAMALATSVAESIQGEIMREEMEDRIILHHAYLDRRIQIQRDLLFAVRNNGEVTSFPPGRLKELKPLLRQLYENDLRTVGEKIMDTIEGEISFEGVPIRYRITPMQKKERGIGFLVQMTDPNQSKVKQWNKHHPKSTEKGMSVTPPKRNITLDERSLSQELTPTYEGISSPLRNLLSRSRRWNELLLKAEKAAKTEHPILLIGESGTGKELLAHAIHDASQRRDGPFIPINCGAIPNDLAVSLLFGYAAGAFTGASKQGNQGAFEAARGGTLFLDEIGELSPEIQKMLLRVLQENEVLRLGEQKARKVDARIIAATNRELKKEVETGRFRSDLYYRLFILPLFLPPLRERREDIPTLIERFLLEGERAEVKWSDEVLHFLETYEWPGNVRELKNTIAYIKTFTHHQMIRMDDLPEWLLSQEQTPLSIHRMDHPKEEQIALRKDQTEYAEFVGSIERGEAPFQKTITPQVLQALLLKYHFNLSKVAKTLHISRGTLYRYLHKFNIPRKSAEDSPSADV